MRIKINNQVSSSTGPALTVFNVGIIIAVLFCGISFSLGYWDVVLFVMACSSGYELTKLYKKTKYAIVQLDITGDIVVIRFQNMYKNLQRFDRKKISITTEEDKIVKIFLHGNSNLIGYIERRFLEKPDDWQKVIALDQ